MATPSREPPPPAADWELYRALREQWTHEDNLVNHRLMWLILSQGLLFTAYGGMSGVRHAWLVMGFPFFGIAVAGVIAFSIFAALEATDDIRRRFDAAGLERLCGLSPESPTRHRGRWAAMALPYVFAALWLLAFAGSIGAA